MDSGLHGKMLFSDPIAQQERLRDSILRREDSLSGNEICKKKQAAKK